STLILTAMQAVLGIIGLTALSASSGGPDASLLAAGFLPGLLLLAVANTVAFAIQNTAALLYPAWVRTEIRPAGIEAMGQHLLTAGVSFLLLLLAFAVPVMISGSLAYFLWHRYEWWSTLPASLVAALALAG